MRAITPGLPLFLYNYTTHQLHGIFEVVPSVSFDVITLIARVNMDMQILVASGLNYVFF